MASPIRFFIALCLFVTTCAHGQAPTHSSQIGSATLAITSLKVVGFNDAQDLVELQGLVDGQTLDLALLGLDNVNVMAEVADDEHTGSVHFALSGPISINRWENNSEYTLDSDSLNIQQQGLPVGNYRLTVTPYELPDMDGQKGTAKTVSFTVVDSKTIGPTVPPIAAAELVAIDEATGIFNSIRRITDGGTINTNDLKLGLVNIVAISQNASKTGSVLFDLDGPVKISRSENQTAFTLADKNEHLNALEGGLPEGEYTLIITPFSEADAQGEAGVPLMLNFSIGEVAEVEEDRTASTYETQTWNSNATTRTVSGFTAIQLSADSKRIYVSSSVGDDDNSCLNEASPCESIKAGLEKMRAGYPDHIYLKRGDVWQNESLLGLSSGRSAEEPAVVAYYGINGARPKIESSGSALHVFQNRLANINIIGIEFSSHKSATPTAESNTNGGNIVLWGASQNILFEDNKFSQMAVVVKAWKNAKPANIQVRRNIWVDNATSTKRLAKLHIDGAAGVLVEENVFNYGADSYGSVQNPPVAISDANSAVILRANIIVGSAGDEEHLVPGAVAQNNFITAEHGSNRFKAFMEAVSNRPLGFWNDRYSSSAIDVYMQAG